MHDYLSPLQAIHEDGTVVLFNDVDDLCGHLDWLSRQGGLGTHHSISAPDGDGKLTAVCFAVWVLRDDCGRTIDPRGLYELRRWWTSKSKQPAAAFGLAIPGTGRRKRHRGSYMRVPRTFQELRANAGLEGDRDDFPVPVEQIRSRKFLPTAWDDIMRGREKNWKRHRSSQWKDRG